MEGKGVLIKPYVTMGVGNKAQFGFGYPKITLSLGFKSADSFLLDDMQKVSKTGEPITVDHFFKAESENWLYEDPAIFIGEPWQYMGKEPPKKENDNYYPSSNEKPAKHYLEIG